MYFVSLLPFDNILQFGTNWPDEFTEIKIFQEYQLLTLNYWVFIFKLHLFHSVYGNRTNTLSLSATAEP
jgi:hypothetical protein